jgi:hypothetical protein
MKEELSTDIEIAVCMCRVGLFVFVAVSVFECTQFNHASKTEHGPYLRGAY